MTSFSCSARSLVAAAVVLFLAFVTPIAHAECSAPAPDFGQYLPNCADDYCVVISPGPGTADSVIGSYWSFTFGAPAIGQGSDNGGWSAANWLQTFGARLILVGSWDSSSAIDGCISWSYAPGKSAEVMMLVLADEGSPSPSFGAAAARRVIAGYPEFDFTFVQGGGQAQNITLVAIPEARIASATRPSTYVLTAPTPDQVAPGLYGDGSLTSGEMVKGYRVYTRTGVWSSHRVAGGWTPVTAVLPLGQNASVTLPVGQDISIAYTLVFDGDFETAYVGKAAHPVQLCHPVDADGDGVPDAFGDPECCPIPELCDCNDANPAVHPGATEVCNGIDDDCDLVADNVRVPVPTSWLQLTKDGATVRLDWSLAPGATRYDVVRGDLSVLRTSHGDFSLATSSCVGGGLTTGPVDDNEAVAAGAGTWYLLAAGSCGVPGSFGSGYPEQFPAESRDWGITRSNHSCP